MWKKVSLLKKIACLPVYYKRITLKILKVALHPSVRYLFILLCVMPDNFARQRDPVSNAALSFPHFILSKS